MLNLIISTILTIRLIFLPLMVNSRPLLRAGFSGNGQNVLFTAFYIPRNDIHLVVFHSDGSETTIGTTEWSDTIGGHGYFYHPDLEGDEVYFVFRDIVSADMELENYSWIQWYIDGFGFRRLAR